MTKPKKEKELDIVDEEIDAVEEVVEKKTTKPKKDITVKYETGERVYSLAIHGEDFEDLAKEFVSKSPNTRSII